jgi:hypothetical protein
MIQNDSSTVISSRSSLIILFIVKNGPTAKHILINNLKCSRIPYIYTEEESKYYKYDITC